jgi:outer membrane protein assembly factor BamA
MLNCILMNFHYYKYIVLVLHLFLLAGCSVEKYIPDGKCFLKNVEVVCNDKKVGEKYQFVDYVQQHPNSKWFGMKIPLCIYKLSGVDSTTFTSKLFRKIGEAPVVYDSVLVANSISDMKRMLSNEGYIYADVQKRLNFNESSKKVSLTYVVDPGKRYFIRTVKRYSMDSTINDIINSDDTLQSLLKPGAPLNINALNEERGRLTRMFQNDGYYKFNKEYVTYLVDTCDGGDSVDLNLEVKLHLEDGRSAPENHKKYHIGKVNFYCDTNKSLHPIDSVVFNESVIYYDDELNFRPKLLFSNNKLRSGEIFKDENLQRTYRNFAQLSAISYSNISLSQRSKTDTIDCDIIVNKSRPKAVAFDVEGTNSAGDLGAAVSATYQHNNLFKGAENLTFKLRYAYEAITGLDGYDGENYHEFGAEMRLRFPVFLFPFVTRDFGEEHHASSEISLQYNFQNRPEFYRRVLSAAWRYRWNNSDKRVSHKFDLLEVNYVYMPWISSRFKEQYLDSIGKTNAILKYNYENLLITKLGYTFAYNSTGATAAYGRNSLSVKANIETSGNLLSALTGIANSKKNSDGQYAFFNIAFAQYVKGDLELTKSFRIDRNNSITFHTNIGIAYPYGNSSVLPFEKRYFSGGANSVRGWSIRSLGPGSYNGGDRGINFINQSGDIKLDLNLEYRAFLFWKFIGALFVDAGNIWTIREYKDQPGGCFKFDEFYKQIAVSYGLGLRMNLDFFILRFDAGMKAIDPVYKDKRHYPILSQNFKRDFAFHFAVGMPF